MNIRTKCIISIAILTKYLRTNFGEHVPYEIIRPICTLYAKLINTYVSCGHDHTILIKQGDLYAWGNNEHGQLGLGNLANQNSPQKIDLDNVIVVASSTYYTMAVTINNKLYAWGDNSFGELGLGNNFVHNLPQKVNLDNVRIIKCGDAHTMAITTNNELYAWGRNNYGQLGLGKNSDNICENNFPQQVCPGGIRSVSCGIFHTAIITTCGDLYACGDNTYGQLGLGHNSTRNALIKVNLDNIISISCGDYHTMAVTTTNELYAWGHCAQLGVGDRYDHNRPHKINLTNVIRVSSGCNCTAAITTNNEIYFLGGTNKSIYGEPQKINLNNIAPIISDGHNMLVGTINRFYIWRSTENDQFNLCDIRNGNLPKKLLNFD